MTVKVIQEQLPSPPLTAGSQTETRGPLCANAKQKATPAAPEGKAAAVAAPQNEPKPVSAAPKREPKVEPKVEPKAEGGKTQVPIVIYQSGQRLYDRTPYNVVTEARRGLISTSASTDGSIEDTSRTQLDFQ